MSKSPIFNLRIPEKKKERWEDHVDENGQFGSLAELIRHSVEQEISSFERDSDETPALENDIQQLQSDIHRIKRDVRFLREQKQDEDDISNTAQDVLDELVVLPVRNASVPEDSEVDENLVAANIVVAPNDEEDEWNPQTTAAIADRMGLDEDVVEDAIEHLEDQFLPVVEVEIMGETHYFKEE